MSARATLGGSFQNQHTCETQATRRRRARRQIDAAIRTSLEPLERRQLLSGGTLDTTFNTTGLVTTDFAASQDQGYATVVQSDGKIVVVGQADAKLGVVRYNADGSLDGGFGAGGKVSITVGANARATAVALDGNQIVVGGYAVAAVSPSSQEDFVVAKLNADGTLDNSFGVSGVAATDIGGNKADVATGLMIQPDGKIVLVGGTGPSATADFAIVRYNVNGTLDTGFNLTGKTSTNFGAGDQANAVTLGSGNTIVVAGRTGQDVALARYSSAGALDTSFNVTGKVTSDLSAGGADSATGIAVDGSGNYLVGGVSNSNFVLARYSSAGALDTGFGVSGKVTTDFGADDQANSMAVQSRNGKIVLVGSTTVGTDLDIAVARYNIDGSLDAAFGAAGKVMIDISGLDDVAGGVAIAPNGKVVVAGYSSSGADPDNFAVASLEGNTVPVLTTASATIDTILEDQTNNPGTSIASLLSGVSISDADNDPGGVAITTADTTNGTWQYSTNSGGS